jgi:acetolactate synthase-1/3 small subunit
MGVGLGDAGVLSKISGMISARGFNIDSLVVGRTDIPDLSRMTLVFFDTQDASEQVLMISLPGCPKGCLGIQDACPPLSYLTPGLALVQLRAQLEDLVPVWAVFDYTDAHVLERELILVKVSLDKENGDLPLRMRRCVRVVCRPCL